MFEETMVPNARGVAEASSKRRGYHGFYRGFRFSEWFLLYSTLNVICALYVKPIKKCLITKTKISACMTVFSSLSKKLTERLY